jgi:hypothetical protein
MPGLLAPHRSIFTRIVLQPGFWIRVDKNWMRNQVLNFFKKSFTEMFGKRLK